MDLTMMKRVGDRWEKMEGSCSTGQSPQWAVVPVEDEEEVRQYFLANRSILCNHSTNMAAVLNFSDRNNAYIMQGSKYLVLMGLRSIWTCYLDTKNRYETYHLMVISSRRTSTGEVWYQRKNSSALLCTI
jgi:hypothetical protein